MKQDTKQMYATMSPWRLFFIVALPGMVSMFAMSIYSIIEGAFIGHTLGEEALAAVNIAFPVIMINFSLAFLPPWCVPSDHARKRESPHKNFRTERLIFAYDYAII